jgi:hypothetical protein
VTAFIMVFVLSRLTSLNHPLFDVPGFESASIDRFWIGVEANDEKFDAARTSDELTATGALRVEAVRP